MQIAETRTVSRVSLLHSSDNSGTAAACHRRSSAGKIFRLDAIGRVVARICISALDDMSCWHGFKPKVRGGRVKRKTKDLLYLSLAGLLLVVTVQRFRAFAARQQLAAGAGGTGATPVERALDRRLPPVSTAERGSWPWGPLDRPLHLPRPGNACRNTRRWALNRHIEPTRETPDSHSPPATAQRPTPPVATRRKYSLFHRC